MKKRRREYHVIIERDEDGYLIAEVPELPGCHTQARSLTVLMRRIEEAILLWLEAKGNQPAMEFIGVQRVAV